MSFKDLNVEELRDVAEFFMVDVTSAKEKPNKGEVVAALAAGDDPVTWKDYEETYLPAKASEKSVNGEDDDEPVHEPEPEDKSDYVLVKMERKSRTWETGKFVFTKAHPFASVPPHVAKYLITQVKGFRLAMPDEVTDYYG